MIDIAEARRMTVEAWSEEEVPVLKATEITIDHAIEEAASQGMMEAEVYLPMRVAEARAVVNMYGEYHPSYDMKSQMLSLFWQEHGEEADEMPAEGGEE